MSDEAFLKWCIRGGAFGVLVLLYLILGIGTGTSIPGSLGIWFVFWCGLMGALTGAFVGFLCIAAISIGKIVPEIDNDEHAIGIGIGALLGWLAALFYSYDRLAQITFQGSYKQPIQGVFDGIDVFLIIFFAIVVNLFGSLAFLLVYVGSYIWVPVALVGAFKWIAFLSVRVPATDRIKGHDQTFDVRAVVDDISKHTPSPWFTVRDALTPKMFKKHKQWWMKTTLDELKTATKAADEAARANKARADAKRQKEK